MAGDWMKVEKVTPDKPEIYAMADILDIDPDAVFGKCFRIWSWFDDHTEKGNAPSVTFALLDRKSSVTGFGKAMEQVGWLTNTDEGLNVPNFDRHCGETAKRRGLTAKRVAKSKKTGNAKGNAKVTLDALPEKRREEKSITHTHTATAEGFSDEWDRWLCFRESIDGRKPDPISSEANLMELCRRGPDKAKRDIEFSIRKEARSILDSDNDFQKRSSSSRTPSKKELGF